MIKRELFRELVNHLPKKEISLITGPRQAGKTTLMKLLKSHIEKTGGPTIFLNLDIEEDSQFFSSQEKLLRKIELEIGQNGYVFLDEIQRKENAGLFLKGLFDMDLSYKYIVSGSGSLELKEKIHESLAGRKRVFELSTLSFTEFINYKTKNAYETKLFDFLDLHKDKTKILLEEYLQFGGYPKVVLENTVSEKRNIIAELYQSYLERDILSFLGVQKSASFSSLVQLMASQIGQIINVSELSSTLGIHVTTINHYLWYMEKTYILNRLTPYFHNFRKEISKAPMLYFFDLGMRNYALGSFGSNLSPAETGFLFQNFVYNILKKKIQNTSYRLNFWRTTNKAEVDFVQDHGTEIIPIEVKYQYLPSPSITKSLGSFITTYQPQKAIVVHLGEKFQRKVGNTLVEFLPYTNLLFTDLT